MIAPMSSAPPWGEGYAIADCEPYGEGGDGHGNGYRTRWDLCDPDSGDGLGFGEPSNGYGDGYGPANEGYGDGDLRRSEGGL
jgi:hypothetical protein